VAGFVAKGERRKDLSGPFRGHTGSFWLDSIETSSLEGRSGRGLARAFHREEPREHAH